MHPRLGGMDVNCWGRIEGATAVTGAVALAWACRGNVPMSCMELGQTWVSWQTRAAVLDGTHVRVMGSAFTEAFVYVCKCKQVNTPLCETAVRARPESQ